MERVSGHSTTRCCFSSFERPENLVVLLLDHGISPARRTYGYLPTEIAIKYEQQAIYDLLIARGGQVVQQKDAAQLSLVEALSVDDHLRMRKALRDGARINGPDASGTTPLLAGLDRPVYDTNHATSISWAIENGADANQAARPSNFEETNQLPLNLFVMINAGSMNGEDEDARSWSEWIMRGLLEAGARVSGMDSNGLTPLHWAAKVDNLRAAEILIREGARISPRDKEGTQPLDYAKSARMIKLLKANGATE